MKLRCLAFHLALLFSINAVGWSKDSPTHPHAESGKLPKAVVLIYADDLGYGDLSCYVATKVQTPNIDRLAKDGRLFTDAHSPSAVCTPSRYGLLTGEYPWRIGSRSPVFAQHGLIVDPEKRLSPISSRKRVTQPPALVSGISGLAILNLTGTRR